ncbi:GNAT family N-acetyltransferase [Kribbella sandramycini]|uniref:GNAT family N-acetyltransferase n=1 Tax=Kribbella sandramycini TaxID=60450 RepID=A0A7Y4L2I1_9ACTN|nr:GNAT family N-acetyltransferase [Kribbella sandramycini]MBB6571432.1 RimJ/RimL family protein N-acetyltransferase [Kribbella sandramycini]NOL43168.1 GNAT family N-acetyltransferase [Kribbella sandramycini]
MEPKVVYETERVRVRDWTPADGDRVFDIYRRWEVSRWLGADPKVMADRDAATRVITRWNERNQDPLYGVWAVHERATDSVAGTVLLVPLPEPSDGTASAGEVEVGWHFHPDAWGRGLATEAARGAIEHGFKAGLERIYAVVRPDNAASLAVCRRLGMRSVGRTSRWYDAELEAFLI